MIFKYKGYNFLLIVKREIVKVTHQNFTVLSKLLKCTHHIAKISTFMVSNEYR